MKRKETVVLVGEVAIEGGACYTSAGNDVCDGRPSITIIVDRGKHAGQQPLALAAGGAVPMAGGALFPHLYSRARLPRRKNLGRNTPASSQSDRVTSQRLNPYPA